MEYNFASNIFHFTSIRSTNTYIHENMELLPDRSIVIADQQFCGKGRYGREWVSSNTENLYLSFFLKGNSSLQSTISNITQFTAVVVALLIEDYLPSQHKPCMIKWPNDVLVTRRKIAGILAESKWIGQSLKGVAVGIGLNLNMTRKEVLAIDKPATSLNLVLKHPVDRYPFVKGLVFRFLESYNTFLCNGMVDFQNDLDKRLVQRPQEDICNKGDPV
ncbi:MAG: biotin--[acetyl-CoA-carboxylase] ligase [Caldisericia bacterium]|nr:biotin--[acetyl-CoA-carboxylase] ligase [Caldisericia bacterium]MDD4614386.1 biotin--[acetyl-CoA-carboxylase] ligase [Caldisericia bacterium]